MEFSIYQLARQRIAGATIKAPTKKVTLSECGHLVKAKEPKKQRAKHLPTPEEIEERKARQRKYSHDWYLRHKNTTEIAVNGPRITETRRDHGAADITGRTMINETSQARCGATSINIYITPA